MGLRDCGMSRRGRLLEPTMLHYRSASLPDRCGRISTASPALLSARMGRQPRRRAATAPCAYGRFPLVNRSAPLWAIRGLSSALPSAPMVRFARQRRRGLESAPVESGHQAGRWPSAHCGSIIYSVAFSPDGKTLLTGLLQGSQVLRWNRTSRSKVGLPLKHLTVYNVTVLRDGSRIVSASEDQTARIWDAGSGQQVGPPLPHSASISGLAVSSDGRFVVSGSADGSLRLWKIAPGNLHHTLRPSLGWLRTAAFSLDGSTLLIGGGNAAQRWDVATEHAPGQPTATRRVITLCMASPSVPMGRPSTRWIAKTKSCIGRETTSGRVLGVTAQKHGDEIWRMASVPTGPSC